jgi:phospholipase/lecithinase/hemolysin
MDHHPLECGKCRSDTMARAICIQKHSPSAGQKDNSLRAIRALHFADPHRAVVGFSRKRPPPGDRAMQSSLFISCLVLLALTGGIVPATAAPFTAIYAFGDSLSDAGNDFILTGGAVPASPYFAGHFSNGPTWIEDLSQNLDLGTLRPLLAGGSDYAFGGAATGPAVPGATAIVPNITQQVDLFSLLTLGHAPSTGLYSLWIGSNDVIQALDDIAATTLTIPEAQADLAAAAQTAAEALQTLASEGAKRFIVPLVPDIGKAPVANGNTSTATLATALSAGYNADLTRDISLYTASDAIAVHFLDTFSLLDAAVADPAAFGYSNVTDPCYTGSVTGSGPPACATPNSYLFWDQEHPSEPGHQMLAAVAKAELPEPDMLPFFLAAALILAWRRASRR